MSSSSSSSFISYLNFINQQINIYFGFTILTAGTIGGILNILVFLSLRTFRQNSCAFYLIIMSIVNLGQLYTGLLSRVMISGYGIDWTAASLFYCKFRLLFFQICTLISYTSLSLATIDQYFATCSRPDWQRWCNIKLARRLILATTFIWILHGIPYAILFVQVKSPTTGIVTCTNTITAFVKYRNYFVGLAFSGFLPVIITVTFGLLAFRNVQQLAFRTVPLVRRELDTQLTKMVLAQVLLNFLTAIPFVIINAVTTNPNMADDAVIWAKLQLAFGITLMIYYSYFASPFYIYICASERFRRQPMSSKSLENWRLIAIYRNDKRALNRRFFAIILTISAINHDFLAGCFFSLC